MTEFEADRPGEDGVEPAAVAYDMLVHDINNIVGRMLANLHLCLLDTDPAHPVRERLETIHDSARELRGLSRKLGEFTPEIK